MLRRALASVVLVVGIVAASTLPAQASIGWGCDEGSGECTGVIVDPGTPPEGGGSDIGSPIEIGFTPGPTTCTRAETGEEIECSTPDGWWNEARQCWVDIADPQRTPPAGQDPNGAYYTCVPATDPDEFIVTYEFWSATPPPGVNRYSPAQAARILISRFQLAPIEVGRTPVGGERTYIGLPVWLWAANPAPLTTGPYSETATLGGQTITATASVTTITYNMGDGTSFACGTGTPYEERFGVQGSPTCDHYYTQTSGDGAYTITATSNWTVTWTSASGAGGTINLTRASTSALEIGELQSVNVPNLGNQP